MMILIVIIIIIMTIMMITIIMIMIIVITLKDSFRDFFPSQFTAPRTVSNT